VTIVEDEDFIGLLGRGASTKENALPTPPVTRGVLENK
jgi:hypothetical protein